MFVRTKSPKPGTGACTGRNAAYSFIGFQVAKIESQVRETGCVVSDAAHFGREILVL